MITFNNNLHYIWEKNFLTPLNKESSIYVDTENDKSDIFKSLDQQIKLFNEYYINSIQELLDENKSIIEFYISKKQLVNF